ncbi:polyamine ABC transporter ATP-binding protein [Sinorhizobium medicae]|uniref:Spermidine/putrescine import ATP-binding protein PotA n=1 Tax=Sinorhizobium medicae (strain WSM419) TaxID=366394 RepID=A6UKQ0_SINMW|nr:ABC transporter ATP-binding protein [Sinorhizobium medicae]ABR64230.1 spermidine/putrescine ABC transporter ATPase subunit [Sinorhizobium medicae WSM419]MDX0430663.1 polyamine ABC transporter ATP-binding protein [Sinorhizobium medicae]MDX0445219.1 polyamine ABC transporter ATP-binding protein [Sinorhizobium medicae]MDX0489755.1 polyamine ABC transporter ATP-binding protein [Sinorhizobium medicae]MDX0523581.1 polyamine ABC transporter ATP-binding protein [Sinorhizobium medicae]
MSSSSLTVQKLAKRYGDFIALAETDLTVTEGEFLTLLGPSGSGKTTLLSLIAGLSRPDHGAVMIGKTDVTYSAPHSRDIGVVFQNYALFPHMTILENIAFPLKMRKVGAEEARKRAQEALEMIRLPHIAQRYPRELSGGQQQRVALARCMVYRPSIILMDEPLGALDKKLREHMQLEIKRIHRELGATIIYVTHDQEEAMTMSDRICLMNSGKIEQLGTPADLYFRPKTLFVADFLGESNLLPATAGRSQGELMNVEIGPQRVAAQALANNEVSVGDAIHIMIRPQNLTIEKAEAKDRISAIVSDVMVTGSLTKIYMNAVDASLPALVAAFPTRLNGDQYRMGDKVALLWQGADAIAISEKTRS